MGGKNKTNKETQTQTSEPWDEQIPYLTYGMSEAKRLYQNAGPEYFPGSTVAGFAPEQEQAMRLGTQRALGGSQTMRNAEGFTNDVLGGKYLNDPYQDQVFQNIQQKVMPSVNSQFMGSGRYNSGMHADTAARAMTEAYAPYASQQRQQGLDRMGQAANMAPTFAANDYQDISALQGIGSQRQDLAQSEIEDAVNRWMYNQQLPYDKLGQFLNNTGGNYGGTTVGVTKTPKPSMFSQIAGGGLGLLGSALSGGMFGR